ncbi:radical SAM domain-containing protein [Gottschalkia acidurici 9a]|uniref:FeMo cofactor biosynthesis protein NifB n=1 Tax=Gottschalkia acidurici (strain ATCC 7906 / DSM 604 / BCRC 14475 / CIP 104303 / KCTC 5404 / NCIMB 10678 / 9a) TaxID=1128398 RepID=K0B3G8_GOTA9|nr:radical SAM protein [Gottschalkia acidurici]AFS79166.1 radical SAM domain-containing protein [Gottschalkia acidurici 9a]
MTYKFDHLVKKHPCFSGEAHVKYGRIHLPVSPSCNIQCKFCKRSFNKCENRPGVSRSIITPEESVNIVDKALDLCPDITVVGIAGPGDTLATDHALDTFQLINRKHPNLIKCLSTNGLKLSEKAERIVESGVKTITVTINAVNPEILKHICSSILYEGKKVIGKDGAEILISNQLEGIKKISDLGTIVKINTVLIPGINDIHVEEIAKTTKKLGASIINVIPLIPQNEMINYPAPNCDQLGLARIKAEQHLPAFKHCKQCRADACGIPGKSRDLSKLLYDRPLQLETFSHG